MKKSRIAVLSILLILCLLAFSSCTTTARWQNKYNDTNGENVDTIANNPSAKYIVYAALNASGEFIPASGEGSSAAVAAYAVVGYTGLVAELTIPSTYVGTNIDASAHNVTQVAVCDSNGTGYAAYKLSMNGAAYTGNYNSLVNNTVVTSIVFGTNVTKVAAGACAGMTNLKSITFEASGNVVLGDSAFAATPSLVTVTGSWTSAANATPFFGSGYTLAP